MKTEQRDVLFKTLREDPNFRELLKKDWRAALKKIDIDPQMVAKTKLSREETIPLTMGRSRASIIIVISALENREQISMSDTVNFEARR